MNWADYVIIGLIALSMLVSLWRGLVKEALSLATWIVALVVSIVFTEDFAKLFTAVDTPSLRNILAFAILFLGVLLIGAVVNHFVHLLVKKTGLTGTDRFLGIFFGAARGIALVAILILLAGQTVLPRDPWWHESRLIPYMQPVALWMEGFLPDNVLHSLSTDTPEKH